MVFVNLCNPNTLSYAVNNSYIIILLFSQYLWQPLLIISFYFVVQPLPYLPTITNYTQLWWVPNVVVAHEKEGIEAIHLASGRTLCKVKKEIE